MATDLDLKILRKSPYLSALSEEELEGVIALGKRRSARAGEIVFREGEPGDSMLLIVRGEAEVFVIEDIAGEHPLHRLGVGETVGEMAVLTRSARSATVRAGTDLEAIEFDAATLEGLAASHSWAMTRAILEVARRSSRHLANANENALKLVRRQIDTARFFMFMVLISCVYIVSADLLKTLGLSLWSALFGIVSLALFAGLGFRVIQLSMLEPAMYGLTSKGLGRDLWSALGISVVVAALLTGAKAALISMNPSLADLPLLSGELAGASRRADWASPAILSALMYAVHSVFQEFLTRGCMQSSLTEFSRGVANGEHASLYGILISNGFFAVMHVHISLGLALAIGMVGFLWGWMRTWQTGIWGICLSHILIGLWALDVLAIHHAL